MNGNVLYYGDNLDILRTYFLNETVDLIYLDPPFNSNRSYNVLFRDESGQESDAQIMAFDDSWHWGLKAEQTYDELVHEGNSTIAQLISAMRQFMGTNQMMAYLVMMAARLIELHRVLKPTGSLYLHCDPTASHYLKILLDAIFGTECFRNEITWKRTFAHGNVGRNYGSIADILLFYTKSNQYTWNQPYKKLSPEEIAKKYSNIDPDGRRWQSVTLRNPGFRPNLHFPYTASNGITYHPHHNGWSCNLDRLRKYDQEGRLHFPAKENGALRLKMYADESPGERVQNIFDDIPPIGAQAAERLGFPTQKPLALLERIIQASSNPGDVVLDPFSGCGTAITAAQKLGRRWAGIDVTHLAISMHKNRLKDMFGLVPYEDYQIIGEPRDLGGARRLAQEDRYQFQWWALSLVQARPASGSGRERKGKKGADQGIDGVLTFMDDRSKRVKRILVQVKSGHVKSGDIRDLRGVLDREKDAPIGLFITLEPPTSEMIKEAVSAGFYRSELWQRDFPRIQILTIEELLQGRTVLMPPTLGIYKTAQRHQTNVPVQNDLLAELYSGSL